MGQPSIGFIDISNANLLAGLATWQTLFMVHLTIFVQKIFGNNFEAFFASEAICMVISVVIHHLLLCDFLLAFAATADKFVFFADARKTQKFLIIQ